MIRCACILIALVLALSGAAGAVRPSLRGADLSTLASVESAGAAFTAGGVAVDPLAHLAARGLTAVRLRLWHTPADEIHGLSATLALARRVRAAGLDLLLDLHYSDTWADPGHQTPPRAWTGLEGEILAVSVRTYTRDVLRAFAAADASPALVQLGNEITAGMVWPAGRVGGPNDSPDRWQALARLLTAATDGVAQAHPGADRPEIMIHLDRGGDNAGCRWFLDNLLATGFDFDLIGLSFYPWWHGSLEDLDANLDDLARRYGKDLVVVETAYPWTLAWFDDTHNPVGEPARLLPDLPATPAGQAAFLEKLTTILIEVPAGLGRGFCWWEPAWIAVPPLGSPWENLTWFDERGAALPAIDRLHKKGPAPKDRSPSGEESGYQR